MNVSIYYGLSKPLPADNSHVYRWESHDDMKEWLNRYSAGKIAYEINTIFPTDGGFIDAPLSFENRPDYVVCEIANTTFCYFVTSIQYLAENSTRVFLSVDAWGTFYGIGDSVAGKFGKCHLIQGHWNNSDLLQVPAIESLQSNYNYLNPKELTGTIKKELIFPSFLSYAVGVFIFAGENKYYTILTTRANHEVGINVSDALAAYKMSNHFNKFGYTDSSGNVTTDINLNSLVSAYIFPYDIFPVSSDFGKNGVLMENSSKLQYARIIESSAVFSSFSNTTSLSAYGTSHFIQIGTKIFSLPQTGKHHVYRATGILGENGVTAYFTVDEQTEEITEEFSLPVYSDTARNFWNQNASSVALQMTASAIGAVGSIATGNVIGAVGSTLAIGQQTANIISRMKQPCKINGAPSFYFSSSPALRGGAEFALPSLNQYSVVSDINNRGFSVDMWRDELEIDYHPNFFRIKNDGTEADPEIDPETGLPANPLAYIYSQFVQVDYLTLKNSICSPSSIDRLRAAFFAGIVVHHEWQSGIL